MDRRTQMLIGSALSLSFAVTACDKGEQTKPKQTAKAVKTAAPKPSAKPEPALPEPPKALGRIQVPKENPITAAKVELGRQLFFDKRMSIDGSVACYSCHQNEDGTGGHDLTAVGAKGSKLTRHAPIIWNVAYLPRLYWDGRADSLEAQVKGAWAGGNMGVGKDNLDAQARELEKIPAYKKQFDEAFPGDGLTPDTVAQAIASYERTLFCGTTAWDKFQAGDASAMNADQKAGWELFIGKAECKNCHTPPFFSDAYTGDQGAYHNVGVGMKGKQEADIDPGRSKVSENPSEWGAFKTPTLRNVTKSPPYFHDGEAATLEDAVRFMASGGFANKAKDPNMVDRKLSDDEIQKLIAFLGALSCDEKLEEPKLP